MGLRIATATAYRVNTDPSNDVAVALYMRLQRLNRLVKLTNLEKDCLMDHKDIEDLEGVERVLLYKYSSNMENQ